MHWLDLVLLGLLALAAALGFWSGLIMQLARLVSLGVAIYATFLLNEPATRLLHEHVAPEANINLLHGMAYIAVFLVLYVALFAASRQLYKLVHSSKIVLLDRSAGALLGLLKMTLVLAPACALIAYLALPATEEWMSRSTVAPLLARGTREAVAMLPDGYLNEARDSMEHVRNRLQQHGIDQAIDLAKIEEALRKK
jgi:uncharacterized membrane protein required for colicin V production